MTTGRERYAGRDRTLVYIAVFVLGGGGLLLAIVLGALWYAHRQVDTAAGPHERALVEAIAARDIAAVTAALASGANVNAFISVGEDGNTRSATWLIVEEMAGRGALGGGGSRRDPALLDIARAIFERGGDPNASISGRRSATWLIEEAVLADSPELIDIMVRAGLDVQGRGTGEALVRACDGEHDTVALALVRAGASVNHRNSATGRTPLSQAVHHRRTSLIEVLEKTGALEWGLPPSATASR